MTKARDSRRLPWLGVLAVGTLTASIGCGTPADDRSRTPPIRARASQVATTTPAVSPSPTARPAAVVTDEDDGRRVILKRGEFALLRLSKAMS